MQEVGDRHHIPTEPGGVVTKHVARRLIDIGRTKISAGHTRAKMDYVPLSIPQPPFERFQFPGRLSTIGGQPPNICLVGACLPSREHVADRNRITDQQNALMSDAEARDTYRILDASANRAGEGLRCLEEFARFVLDDAPATQQLKSLRHELAEAIGRFSRDAMLRARDTGGDVGTTITRPSEYSRSGSADVVAAATARTGQSLRVLEEYGKTIDAEGAAAIERIRYRCYTIFAELERRSIAKNHLHNAKRQRLAEAHLYVLVDAAESESSFARFVQSLFQQGVDMVQLRDREVDDRTLISRARMGTEIARNCGGLFIVNDRADLALASDADGVHVGQDELPTEVARQIVGPDRLVGVSTHSIAQAQSAASEGADYIGCGPVFPGRTKSFDQYVGTQFLTEVSERIDLPAFAIGGIDLSNVREVVQAGIDRIAVTGVVRDADNPTAVIRQLCNELRSPGNDVSHDSPQSADRQGS